MFLLPTAPNQPGSKPSLFLNAGPTGTTDYPWAMFHYDAVRDGVTPASGPASPSLMWTYTTGNLVYPSAAVADGYVFIPSYDGTLYALDEYTGLLLWSFPTGGNIIGTPAVASGIVYVSSKNGYVYALSEQNGAVDWRIANDNLTPVTSSPVIANGVLFYGTFLSPSAGYAEVLAVNPQTGSVIWRNTGIQDYIEGSASVSNGRVFLGAGALNPAIIVALNETTGAQLWSYGTGLKTQVTSAPAEAYGNVYVGLDGTRFLALNQATGSLVWSFNTPGGTNATTPAIYKGAVYFGTGAGIVYALNATTGTTIWRYPTVGTIGGVASSPALAVGSNTLYIGSNDGHLYALNVGTGAVNWRYPNVGAVGQISSSPAVANNRVFFGSKDHKVYALGATAARLFDTITASPNVLLPKQNATLSITVRNSTALQSGANLTLTSSFGGTLSQPIVSTGVGTYQSNFTTPMVTSTTVIVIQVTATVVGYLSATNQTSITVNPFPLLTVVVSPKPTSITPGGEITLMIRVTNGTLLVSGASLNFSSSVPGGSFSSVLDSGNGNYTAIFSTPLQSSNPVVTVRAYKNEFTPGQGQASVAVNGVPNLTTLKVSGIPIFLLVAGLVILFLLILAVVVRSKKNEYSHIGPSSSFSY
jgi:eukaryotic-like serine/threonine-protein kinase